MQGSLCKTLISTTVLSLISACGGSSQWQAYYPSQDIPNSMHDSLFIAADGTIVVSGIMDPSHAFVAAYNGAGKLLWDQVLNDAGVYYLRNAVGAIAQDSKGNIYVKRAVRENYESIIYRFSTEGNQLDSWQSDIDTFFTQLTLDDEDNLYASNTGAISYPGLPGLRVDAFDSLGNVRWHYQNTGNPGSGFSNISIDDLQDYEDYLETTSSAEPMAMAARNATANAYTYPYSLTQNQKNLFQVEDGILLWNNSGLDHLSDNGQLIQRFEPADFNLIEIIAVNQIQGTLTILGKTDNNHEWLTLNPDFSVANRAELGNVSARVSDLSVVQNQVCVSWQSTDSPNDFAIASYDVTGELDWQTPVNVSSHYVADYYLRLKASSDTCYFLSSGSEGEHNTASRVNHFDDQGVMTEIARIADFIPEDFAVHGKAVYQAGISGDYDTEHTVATLVKSPTP